MKPTIIITFRHMDHSPVIEEHARTQLEKLDKFLDNEPSPVVVELVLEAQPVHAHHKIDLLVKSPHYHCFSHDEGPDMYQVLDSVIQKMCTEIRRAKEKRIDNERRGNNRPA